MFFVILKLTPCIISYLLVISLIAPTITLSRPSFSTATFSWSSIILLAQLIGPTADLL